MKKYWVDTRRAPGGWGPGGACREGRRFNTGLTSAARREEAPSSWTKALVLYWLFQNALKIIYYIFYNNILKSQTQCLLIRFAQGIVMGFKMLEYERILIYHKEWFEVKKYKLERTGRFRANTTWSLRVWLKLSCARRASWPIGQFLKWHLLNYI